MQFEWDEQKRQRNIDQHGVDFADAAIIFASPLIALARDTRQDYGEQRYVALGQVDEDYFVVIFTDRGEYRRIISAWKVDENGRRRYQTLLSKRTH